MTASELWPLARTMLLLGVANGTPIIARWLLGARYAWPLDGGLTLGDGRRLFGPSKTLRGLLLSLLTTTLAAASLGLPASTGLAIGALAMCGDLASSFTKRRLGRAPSSMAPGLDQIPESLLPLLVCYAALGIRPAHILPLVALFIVLELLLSRWLYRLGVRDRPY